MTGEYTNPLCSRYASYSMKKIFSEEEKISNWRSLWVSLAEVEKSHGANITDEQISEMRQHIGTADLKRAAEIEKDTRHDVVAHIRLFAEECPKAAPIIHLGATSCFVADNADVIAMQRAMMLTEMRRVYLVNSLANFASEWRSTPTVGYTHLQSAQLTTVGKRAAMWLQDFMMDLDEIRRQFSNTKSLPCRGPVGSSCPSDDAMEDFENDLCLGAGLPVPFDISGQTYTRKQDFSILQSLSGIAQSAAKMSNDIRFLSSTGEMVEPHEKTQVGSSAMVYKCNPIRCERVGSLSRFVINNAQSAAYTAASQFLERTLDDSAIRRITIPETFLAVDAILNLCADIVDNLTVVVPVVEKKVEDAAPFLATEKVLSICVARGGNRQEAHEVMREASACGPECLVKAMMEDKRLRLNPEEVDILINDAKTNVGKCPSIVSKYVRKVKLKIAGLPSAKPSRVEV